MRISDWSSDVCSSDLHQRRAGPDAAEAHSALHPILLEQIIERRPADPEQFRGGRDIALALRHRAADRDAVGGLARAPGLPRSEEHTSELQSLMRISYAVFCLQKKKTHTNLYHSYQHTLHHNL